MNRSVSRRLGWRIAVAISAVAGLLLAPSLAGTAVADDLSFTSAPSAIALEEVGVGEFAYPAVFYGPWSPSPDSYLYQWYFNDVAVPNATSRTYLVPSADEGGNLSLAITAVKAGYESSTVTSGENVVLGELSAGTPTLSAGPYRAGVPITVDPGTWGPADTTFTYSWSNLYGQVSTSNTVTPSDVDLVGLTATVTGHHDGYAGMPVQVDTGPIAPDHILTGTPTISGGRSPYSVLTADPDAADWKPGTASFSYQWNRDGTAIANATSANFLVPPADLSHHISVTVTGSAAGYSPVSVTSASELITPGKLKLPRATITGTPGIGHGLIAHLNILDVGNYSFTFWYAWYVNGVPVTDVDDATGEYFPDSKADVGKRVTVALAVNYANYPTQEGPPSAPTAPIADGTPVPGKAFLYPVVGMDSWPGYLGPVNTTGVETVKWFLDGTQVATGRFMPTAADWHHSLSVSVTENTDYGPVTTISPSALIQTGYVYGTPKIAGDRVVKRGLSIDYSSLNMPPQNSTVYWYEISGRSHVLVGEGPELFVERDLAGHSVFAVVHASGYGVYPTQLQTAPVTIAPLPSGVCFAGGHGSAATCSL